MNFHCIRTQDRYFNLNPHPKLKFFCWVAVHLQCGPAVTTSVLLVVLVPDVRALHTGAICYGKWHHWCASAAASTRMFCILLLQWFTITLAFSLAFLIRKKKDFILSFSLSLVVLVICFGMLLLQTWIVFIVCSWPKPVFEHTKKRASCERHKSSVILNTQCAHIGCGARGWGGTLLRGTCHMLFESGLKQKPIKCKQDSQPGSQTLPRAGEGSRGWEEVDVCAGVCFC